MNHALLKILASAALGNIPTGADAAFPQWNGPDPTTIHVQAILYSSLAASLLSAFIAMLGKQWLNRYAWVDKRGSVIDRSRHRQQKMDGMDTWHFDLVMECLPLMLQAALLLLGYALSNYLFSIDNVVAGVITGFTAFGLLFYFLIISAATLSYNCPFQTPLSLILCFLIQFDNEHWECLKKSGEWFRRLFSWRRWRQSQPQPGGYHNLGGFDRFDRNNSANHIELPVVNLFHQPTPLFDKLTDWGDHMMDSNCIAWMFEKSMDKDVIMAIMRFIPEVAWHDGIQTTPLKRVYDTFLECCDKSSGCPIVIPKFRNMAYFSAKALLHLIIQRKCFGDESDQLMLDSISKKDLIMGINHSEDDKDLESTLSIINQVLSTPKPTAWCGLSFTTPHHAWMGHVLLYYTWDVLRKDGAFPNNVKEFISYSVQLKSPPPAPIVADCFFLIGFLLGVNLHQDDLLVIDKR